MDRTPGAQWPYPQRKKTATVLVAMAAMAGLAVTGIRATFLSASAQSSPNGATLAQQYLAALKPAGAAINTAESRLAKLPVTASVSQVRAIVAPLPKALVPVESLTQGAPGAPGSSLEGLKLKYRFNEAPPQGGVGCGGNGKVAPLFNALVDGTVYDQGFQLVTTCGGGWGMVGWASYRWELPRTYTKFSAGIAAGVGDTCRDTVVRILGASGRPIPFQDGHGLTYYTTISHQGLVHLTADVTSQAAMSIWLGFANCQGATSVVDVINDRLS